MSRPPRTAAPFRLNLGLPESFRARLEVLRQATGADTLTEVIRRALLLYERVIFAAGAGSRLYERTASGREVEWVVVEASSAEPRAASKDEEEASPYEIERHNPARLLVNKVSSSQAGACNFCTRHSSAHGTLPHRVLELRSSSASGSLVARVCEECAADLKIALRRELP